jgi:hypothetical protein
VIKSRCAGGTTAILHASFAHSPPQKEMESVMAMQVFDVPSGSGMGWLSFVLLIPITLSIVLAGMFWARPLRVEVNADAIQIRGSIYGRAVARGDLRIDQARIVDLSVDRDLVPRLRTNGVGLPNYRVGWFRLRNGQSALCFLTRSDSVLYVPTKQNYALLVSTSEPTELLGALQNAHAS